MNSQEIRVDIENLCQLFKLGNLKGTRSKQSEITGYTEVEFWTDTQQEPFKYYVRN
jgi:hypothetical protein